MPRFESDYSFFVVRHVIGDCHPDCIGTPRNDNGFSCLEAVTCAKMLETVGVKMEERDDGEMLRLSVGRQHFDLIQKPVFINEESGTVTFSIEADPRRYKWQELDGKWIIVDKFEPAVFQVEDFLALLSRVLRTPVYQEIKHVSDEEIKKKSPRLVITRRAGRDVG